MERTAPRNAGWAVTSLTRSPSTKTRLPSLSERRYSAPVRIGNSPGSIYLARARQACHRRMLTQNVISASGSVYVGLVSAGFLKFAKEGGGLVSRTRAMLADYLEQSALDVAAHGDGAADIDVRAFRNPAPEVAAGLAHAVLHIAFAHAVARPRQRKSGEETGSLHADEFVLVEKIVVAALVAKEQPVAAPRFRYYAFLQKSPKRGDTRARTDHDDRHRRISGQAEALRFLHIGLDLHSRHDTFGKESRCYAEATALAERVAHLIDGKRNATSVYFRRTCNRIKPRLQRIERFNE